MWSALKCLSRIQIPLLTRACTRHYTKTSENMAKLLKQADHIPPQYDLIYRVKKYRMAGFMYHTVIFGVFTSFTVTGYQLYYNGFGDGETGPDLIRLLYNSPTQGVLYFIVNVAYFFLVTAVRKRYPIRMYYNEQTKNYKAIFYGKVPFMMEHYEFPAACATYTATKDSLVPWKSISFDVNGRKMLLFDENFRSATEIYTILDPEEIKRKREES